MKEQEERIHCVITLVTFSHSCARQPDCSNGLHSLICILLTTGSVIMGLVWVFLDFFAGMAAIDVYSWLPLIVLLVVMALLITEKWLTTALSIPLVIVALTGLYYLLFLIGSLVWLAAPIIAAIGLIVLLLLNGSVYQRTRRAFNLDQGQVLSVLWQLLHSISTDNDVS